MKTELSTTETYPSVDVAWLTETDLNIRCPYCEEFHRHGFVSYKSARRVPHCGTPDLQIDVNFQSVAYQIDKKVSFVNIRTPGYREIFWDETSLSGEFSNLSSTASEPPKQNKRYIQKNCKLYSEFKT